MAGKAGKTGRPSPYKSEYAGQAQKLCELGATDAEIADFFNVDARTVYRWKHDHEDFCQALKAGKAAADERVERSLYHRAVGYEHPDVHISNYQGDVTATPIVKHYPPDTTAMIFWLKNRRRAEWRDKQEHEHSGRDGGPIETLDVSNLTPVERAQRLAAILAGGGPKRD
jgi:hypothetical protein